MIIIFESSDIVTLGQGDRGIMEFKYPLPGQFMFHAHINHFTDLGWVGFFNVTNAVPTPTSPMASTSPSLSSLAGGSVSPQEVPIKK